MKVLDLFCGAGGLAMGFSKAGFDVHGVDKDPVVEDIFRLNGIGTVTVADLRDRKVFGSYDVVVGGPPCRPWSQINVVKRGKDHPDYGLIEHFASHVTFTRPRAFLLENVPPASPVIFSSLKGFEDRGYSIEGRTLAYSDYGAPTSRRRLIVVGIREGNAASFFKNLESYRAPGTTVRDAIGDLAEAIGEVPEHIFPRYQTIEKYRPYYQTQKYGWYILDWEKPAPSFGNVTKTYTLHPSSWNDGNPPRVISVREALRLMGFDDDFVFPEDMNLVRKYQMVADAVSPVFSYAAARALKDTLRRYG